MVHFFEKLEREIDFTKEYHKIEDIICDEYYDLPEGGSGSIDDWIEKNFSKWRRRKAYTSFREVREQCGFTMSDYQILTGALTYVSMEDYFVFVEMILNIVFDLKDYCYMEEEMEGRFFFVIQTIKANLEQIGVEIKKTEKGYIIVEKNALAVEVARENPELADVIIEYNQYLLKGNIKRKREILLRITDALDPKREELVQIDKAKTKDYFSMVNNMNVRHNNCDFNSKNYVKEFAELPEKDKESWYDLIYRQALLLFALLNHQNDKKLIDGFRDNFNT